MADYPVRGTAPWDLTLKAYIDGEDAEAVAAAVAAQAAAEAAQAAAEAAAEAASDAGVAAFVSDDTPSDTYTAIQTDHIDPLQDMVAFWPHKYGAVGDLSADDTAALQACSDAADAVGGKVCYWGPLGQRQYLVNGQFTMGRGAHVGMSSDEVADSTIGTTFRMGDSDARVNCGTWAGGKNPAYVAHLTIDGNGTGDPTGILRLQCESTTLIDVVVRDAAGIGAVFDHAQNCSIHNLKVSECHNDTGVLMDKGAGGNQFYGGHLLNNLTCVKTAYDMGEPAGSQFTYGNKWYGVVMESYLGAGLTDNIIEIDSGFANGFFACQIAANAEPTNDLALVKIVSGAIIPQVEFNSMWFSGHGSAVDQAIDITGTSIASVAITGFTTALNVASLVHTNTAQAAVAQSGALRMSPPSIPVFTKSGAGTYDNHSRAIPPAVTEYETAQTDTAYSVPPGAKYLLVEVAGSGGGGGSGRRGTNLSSKGGGSGGGGAGVCTYVIPIADVTVDTLYVTVGAAGVGGAAQTADDTNGNNGTAGGASYLAAADAPTIGQLFALANGGGAGIGGQSGVVSAGGGQGLGSMVGGNGGASVVSGTHIGGVSTIAGQGGAGQGGGAGGSIASAGGTIGAGGGGFPPIGRWNTVTATGGTSGGGAGTNGTAPTTTLAAGSGGGGGGAHNAGAGGAGGNGGRCSGGGGGGASLNGGNSGKGGDGGLGYVRIIAVFV